MTFDERPRSEQSEVGGLLVKQIEQLKHGEEVTITWDASGKSVSFEPWILESHFDDKKWDASKKTGSIDGGQKITLIRWNDWLLVQTSMPMTMYVNREPRSKGTSHQLKFTDAPMLSWYVSGQPFRLGARK
jgi:hypothetical protein